MTYSDFPKNSCVRQPRGSAVMATKSPKKSNSTRPGSQQQHNQWRGNEKCEKSSAYDDGEGAPRGNEVTDSIGCIADFRGQNVCVCVIISFSRPGPWRIASLGALDCEMSLVNRVNPCWLLEIWFVLGERKSDELLGWCHYQRWLLSGWVNTRSSQKWVFDLMSLWGTVGERW